MERAKVVVTGAGGQLGKDLITVLEHEYGYEVIGLTRQELDITDANACRAVINQMKPVSIIHAAAYTAVDKAEEEEEEAYRVNAVGSRNMAVAAQVADAAFCLISTDYVFDGQNRGFYREFDQTNPLNVYGKSKRAAELLVQGVCPQSFIVRTSWVYGQHGHNFVKTILRLGREGKDLKVVDDQIGCPTYTVDLSRFLGELIGTNYYGIYHASNGGSCSWYEFAKAILEEARMDVGIEASKTADAPRLARRPAFSVMDSFFLRINGFRPLRPWRDALSEFIASMQ